MWITLAGAELAFVPHDVQAAAVAPAVAAKYLPATQSVQTELPCSANLPDTQATQSPVTKAPEVARSLPASHAWRG